MLLTRQDLLVDKVFGKAKNELGGHLHEQAVSACRCAELILQPAWWSLMCMYKLFLHTTEQSLFCRLRWWCLMFTPDKLSMGMWVQKSFEAELVVMRTLLVMSSRHSLPYLVSTLTENCAWKHWDFEKLAHQARRL